MSLRAGILIEAASGQQLAGSGCPPPAPTRQARRKGCCIHSPDLWVPSMQWTKGTPILSLLDHYMDARKSIEQENLLI